MSYSIFRVIILVLDLMTEILLLLLRLSFLSVQCQANLDIHLWRKTFSFSFSCSVVMKGHKERIGLKHMTCFSLPERQWSNLKDLIFIVSIEKLLL